MKFLRYLLFPFSLIYGTFVRVRNAFYHFSFFNIEFPACKVISIGNISTGGTGKTPITAYLIKYFLKKGTPVAYLSRGYGRKTSGYQEVMKSDSKKYGDEASMIKSRFPNIPVAVCEDRIEGAKKLVKKYEVDLILLDDGFQHRRIGRHLDVVVVDAQHSPFEDFLLPMGNLREPVSSLQRAGAIIVNKLTSPEQIKPFEEKLGRENTTFSQYTGSSIRSFWDQEKTVSLPLALPIPVILFCGLGNNAHFEQTALENGFKIIQSHFFADHYRYQRKDLDRIMASFHTQSDPHTLLLLTTEKDYHRLQSEKWFGELRKFPFFYLTIEIKWVAGEKTLINKLEEFI